MAEQLSGGREATAEALSREGEISLFAEGRKVYDWILSSLPGLSCLPSPRKENSEPYCARREIGASSATTLQLAQGEGRTQPGTG